MKDKIKITPGEILEFKESHLVLYASQTIPGSLVLIRFFVGFPQRYQVTRGTQIVYDGSQLTHAIAAWESL